MDSIKDEKKAKVRVMSEHVKKYFKKRKEEQMNKKSLK